MIKDKNTNRYFFSSIAGVLGWLVTISITHVYLLPQNLTDKENFYRLLSVFGIYVFFSIYSFVNREESKKTRLPLKWPLSFLICLFLSFLIVFL